MKTNTPEAGESGTALLMTMIMTGVALATLAGVMEYAATNARLVDRANQFSRATAAAEAATEKVVTHIAQDFLNGGQAYVLANLSSYQSITPTAADSSFWSDWEFNDATGNLGRTFVQSGGAVNYTVINSAYAGLQGFATTFTVVSNARQIDSYQNVPAGVLEQVQLAGIPIFQFAMYTSGDMEISCGQPFTVTGRVHSNGQLYVEPDSSLTFLSSVTAVGSILFQRDPLDTRGSPSGSAVYLVPDVANVPALTLPIGTSNSPTAIREIIEPPAPFEDPTSPLGRSRYVNQADMVVVVSDTGVSATSGEYNGFGTAVPANQLNGFISTTNSFFDARENKTVLPIDINIAGLDTWSATNINIRLALGGMDVSSIYVLDRRTVGAATLGAVRVVNGVQLPPRGLTIATGQPLYVLGDFNQTNNAFLGTSNTTTTLPASLVGDAITILSTGWSDANSTASYKSRLASPTTVNAAILAGAVDTTLGHYGGGMENFPRFLELWGATPFTYNGSMVKLFPSLYATNTWGGTNVYAPPVRKWAFDINFNNPLKLPPLTPSLLSVNRSQWATVAPNQTTAPVSF